jgi:hypothetical protein
LDLMRSGGRYATLAEPVKFLHAAFWLLHQRKIERKASACRLLHRLPKDEAGSERAVMC